MNQKLLDVNCIPTPVELAVKLRDFLKTRASDGAMFLQQLHYWTIKEQGRLIDGTRWIYNTYAQWLQQFPWWEEWDFRVITRVLRELGLIVFKQLNDHGRDRTGYYALNYDHDWLRPPIELEATSSSQVAASPLLQNSSDGAENSSPVHPRTVLGYESDTTPETTPETQTVVVEVEEKAEEVCRPLVNKLDEPTDLEPTREQLDEAITEISAVSPDIRPNPTVRKMMLKYWANLPAAVLRLKKAVRENWRCNLTGVFVNALKEPPAPPAPPAKEYPHPTLKQLNELGTLGRLVHTTLDEPGYPEVLAVDTGREVLPWWTALGVT